MMRTSCLFLIMLLGNCSVDAQVNSEPQIAGNPVFPGWYADPEAIIFGDTYWIYPTFSDNGNEPLPEPAFTEFQNEIRVNTINPQYLKQTFLDAFSSKDLVNWEKHPRVLAITRLLIFPERMTGILFITAGH